MRIDFKLLRYTITVASKYPDMLIIFIVALLAIIGGTVYLARGNDLIGYGLIGIAGFCQYRLISGRGMR